MTYACTCVYVSECVYVCGRVIASVVSKAHSSTAVLHCGCHGNQLNYGMYVWMLLIWSGYISCLSLIHSLTGWLHWWLMRWTGLGYHCQNIMYSRAANLKLKMKFTSYPGEIGSWLQLQPTHSEWGVWHWVNVLLIAHQLSHFCQTFHNRASGMQVSCGGWSWGRNNCTYLSLSLYL